MVTKPSIVSSSSLPQSQRGDIGAAARAATPSSRSGLDDVESNVNALAAGMEATHVQCVAYIRHVTVADFVFVVIAVVQLAQLE